MAGCSACHTTLWLLAVEVTLLSANQIRASGPLVFPFLCFFRFSWWSWRLRSKAAYDCCKDEAHLPWGVSKLWAVMPNRPLPLNSIGPRSHVMYSKTCGFYFFLQNTILCFAEEELAVEYIIRIRNACHLSVRTPQCPLGPSHSTGNPHEAGTEGSQTLPGGRNWEHSLVESIEKVKVVT